MWRPPSYKEVTSDDWLESGDFAYKMEKFLPVNREATTLVWHEALALGGAYFENH